MNRSALLVLVIVLVAAVGVLGYNLYREQHKDTVEIQVGPNGLKVNTP